jgi:hypothetical protein
MMDVYGPRDKNREEFQARDMITYIPKMAQKTGSLYLAVQQFKGICAGLMDKSKITEADALWCLFESLPETEYQTLKARCDIPFLDLDDDDLTGKFEEITNHAIRICRLEVVDERRRLGRSNLWNASQQRTGRDCQPNQVGPR